MLSLEEQIERIADAAMTASLDEGDAAAAPKRAPFGRRSWVGVAAGVMLVGLVGVLIGVVVSREPSGSTEDPASVPAPTTPGVANVAPGVGQWLDLPTSPDGMTLVAGTPFEVNPVCAQTESTISGPICVAISGSAEVAYADQSTTVIEVTTVFVTDTLDDYVTALTDGYPDRYQDQPVTVRGHPGRLLTGDSKLVTWQERPGVIGQVRIVGDTANTDLVALANTLIQRDWDPNNQLSD
jgi:hypothetical protein